MLQISSKVKYAIGIIALSALGIYLLVPRDKKGVKPLGLADTKKIDEKENATIILNAYLNALEAGENDQALAKLNSIFAGEYGMRVQRNKSGKYVARTLDGRDVLMVK